jgi:hypothetical protein
LLDEKEESGLSMVVRWKGANASKGEVINVAPRNDMQEAESGAF